IAKLLLIPLPSRKFRRTESPDPLGATMTTSIFFGGITSVKSPYVIAKPCEKKRVLPSVRRGLSVGQNAFWPASESRYSITVPFAAASSRGNSLERGTQPSFKALSHEGVFRR